MTDKKDRRGFALWLSNELRDRRLTQAGFARKAGLSAALVSNWVSGGRIPSIQSAQAIADALDVDIKVVLTMLGLPMVDDEDPMRMRLLGMLEQMHLTPDRSSALQALLELWSRESRPDPEPLRGLADLGLELVSVSRGIDGDGQSDILILKRRVDPEEPDAGPEGLRDQVIAWMGQGGT